MIEPTPIMDVLRGGLHEPRANRLTIRHLDQRDAALGALEDAHRLMLELVTFERGDSSPVLSPRYDDVRRLADALKGIRDALDEVYV
jgi:hypothetical protein